MPLFNLYFYNALNNPKKRNISQGGFFMLQYDRNMLQLAVKKFIRRANMTLYFYTAHRSACGKIAKALETDGHACNIYTNLDNFYKAVLNMKTYPDLLLLDHLSYDCNTFNIYRYMRDIRCLIPLIVYNEPLPRGSDARLKQWIMTLNLYYGHTSAFDIAAYLPVLKTVAKTVEMYETKPLTCTLRSPNRPDEKTRTPRQSGSVLIAYKQKLPAALFSVFEILYDNRSAAIGIPELQILLQKRGVYTKQGTIYSHISRLRTYLTKEISDMYILKVKNGYRLYTGEEPPHTIS